MGDTGCPAGIRNAVRVAFTDHEQVGCQRQPAIDQWNVVCVEKGFVVRQAGRSPMEQYDGEIGGRFLADAIHVQQDQFGYLSPLTQSLSRGEAHVLFLDKCGQGEKLTGGK